MNADSVHAGVEKEVWKGSIWNIYGFENFVQIMKQSNSGKMDVLKQIKNVPKLNQTTSQRKAQAAKL